VVCGTNLKQIFRPQSLINENVFETAVTKENTNQYLNAVLFHQSHRVQKEQPQEKEIWFIGESPAKIWGH